jgi:U5 small nuclear ribonucleoprotein component
MYMNIFPVHTHSYPLVTTKKEDSGEHVLLGTGELYLDCILRDLRQLYSGIELRVADPMVKLCETVLDTSSMRCSAETAPSHTQLGMVAEPLDRGLAEKIEQGEIPLKSWTPKQVSTYLKEELDWDVLAARNLWSFGPDEERGPNLLMNDTLRGETDRKALNSVRDGIVQGFTWATNEGPLCEEPMRNVKVKLLSAQISQDSLHRYTCVSVCVFCVLCCVHERK